jgi:hypothetical protein
MRHVVSTTADIITDILIILELLPNRVAYLIIIPMFVADLASGWAFLRSFAAPPRDEDDDDGGESALDKQSAKPPHYAMLPSWAAALSWLLASSGRLGRLPHALSSLLIMPTLSITIHLLSAALVLPWRQRGATFGPMDIMKCCELRSLLVSLLEAPASIALTTWAFLATRKVVVGKYVSSTTFFVSLASSMVHVWVGVWDFSGRLLACRGSLRQAWSSFFDLHFDLMTSDIVLFGVKPKATSPSSQGRVPGPPSPPVETRDGPLVETNDGPVESTAGWGPETTR